MRVVRALFQLAAVVVAEVGAVLVLHRLGSLPFLQVGWRDPAGWLALAAPEDVLLALCRVVALGCAYWLLVGTVLYTVAAAAAAVLRVPAALRAVQWAALPPVRRVADRAVAVVLTTSSFTGASGAAWADAPVVPPPPPPVVEPVGDLYRPVPAGLPDPAAAAMPTPVLPAQPVAVTQVVQAGDNLWSIAAGHLAARGGVPVGALDDGQVVAYWRRLVEANRAGLRSGDPDLVQPGEVLVLPPP